MWTCPFCDQKFLKSNQSHSCNDKTLDDFLKGKSELTTGLFWHFIRKFRELGPISIHPTKSMIGLAVDTRIAYITRLGKDFVDVVFMFDQPYEDNLCFNKIAQVPGTKQFNHHFRMMNISDVNKEVTSFMKKAYKIGSREK